MKKIILALFTLIILFSCNKNKEIVGFEINGTLKNIPDSSIVYISKNNKNIDSTIVLNEKFKLTGKLDNPTNVYLIIKNSRDYKSFWLENSKISFDAEQGKFRQAIILGSKTQEEDNIISKRLNEVEKQLEKLENSVDETMTKLEIDSLKKQYEILENKEITTYQNYVKEFPNSLVSSHILNIYATTWGKEKTKELFDKFSLENKNSEYGKSISKYIELNKDPKIGEKYVDFEMKNTDGKIEKISDFNNKIVLLEFWSSNCRPCRKENPNLVKTYEKYNPKGFEIFAVSQDIKKESWLKAIEKDKLPWNQVSDLKGNDNSAFLIYGINGIPDNFLIDRNGIIIARNLRGEELNKKLEEIIPVANTVQN